MKLISLKICPYVQQVRAMLEATRMPYVVEHVESDLRPDWLLKLSPDGGEVPALITDEGVGLFQSDAIMEYLEELSVGQQSSGNPTQ